MCATFFSGLMWISCGVQVGCVGHELIGLSIYK